MKHRILIGVTALLLITAGFAGMARVKKPFQPGSSLTLTGTSSVHDWECKAGALSGTIDYTPTGKLSIAAVTATIPVNQLECGSAPMNKRLQTEMKAAQNPNISYTLKTAKVSGSSVATTGTLTVAGVSKPLNMNVTAQKLQNGNYRFKGSAPLKMSDFGIKAPVFLGMKTGDAVTVTYEIIAAGK